MWKWNIDTSTCFNVNHIQSDVLISNNVNRQIEIEIISLTIDIYVILFYQMIK